MTIDPNREFFLQLIENKGLNGARYSKLQRLGAVGGGGAFSLIFQARDTTVNRDVAIKVFHPERRSDSYRFAAFLREAQMLQGLDGQDGIIKLRAPCDEVTHVVNVGLPSPLSWSFAYYAMELADGDLASDVSGGGFDAEASLVAFREACKPVQRLHKQSIVLRDLKPANCLRMRDGSIKVGDFGSARDLGEPPLVADYGIGWQGDYRYAPPEMIAGLFAEQPSMAYLADFFALGAILFELLTGTTLTGHVYEPTFIANLMATMQYVPVGKRRATLDSFIKQLADARQLPSAADFGAEIPKCVRDRIDALWQALCALDYRGRLHEFPRIFRQIDSALIVLRNESRYLKWLQEKRRRRAIAISAGRLRR